MSDRIKLLRPYLLVAAVAFTVGLPAMSGGFAWDSFKMLEGTSLFAPPPETMMHRPMFLSVLKLQHSLWADHAVYYHIFNSLMHAINSALVYALALRLLGGRARPALFAALFFALHPAATGAVVWVLGGGELMKTAFTLISIILYLAYREEGDRLALGASVLFYLLSVLSGQGALVLPVLLALYEVFIGSGLRRFTFPAAMYIGAIVIYVLVFPGHGEFNLPKGGLGLSVMLSTLGYYTLKMLVPIGFGIMPAPASGPLAFFVGLLFPALAVGLLSEKRSSAGFYILFIVLFILPAVLWAGTGLAGAVANHYMYLPLVGLALLVGMASGSVFGGTAGRAVIVVLLAALCVLSVSASSEWKDRTALWRAASEEAGASATAHMNLAASLLEDGEKYEGREAISNAISMGGLEQLNAESLLGLYISLYPQGEGEGKFYGTLLQYKPPFEAAMLMSTLYGDAFYRDKARSVGLLKRAESYLGKANLANPDDLEVLFKLATANANLGNKDKATAYLDKLVSLDKRGLYSPKLDILRLMINSPSPQPGVMPSVR